MDLIDIDRLRVIVICEERHEALRECARLRGIIDWLMRERARYRDAATRIGRGHVMWQRAERSAYAGLEGDIKGLLSRLHEAEAERDEARRELDELMLEPLLKPMFKQVVAMGLRAIIDRSRGGK